MSKPLVASGGWSQIDDHLTWDDLDADLTWAGWTTTPTVGARIGGVWRRVKTGSLRVTDTVDDHSDLSVDVFDAVADGQLQVAPARGEPAEVVYGDTLLFAGWIDDVSSRYLAADGTVMHTLRVSDHSYLAEKRIVAQVWEDLDAGDIVRWIVDEILAEEGVAPGTPDWDLWHDGSGIVFVDDSAGDAEVTVDDDHIRLETALEGESAGLARAMSDAPQDLTDVDVLFIDWEASHIGVDSVVRFAIGSSSPGFGDGVASIARTADFGRRVDQLDVSDQTGDHHLWVQILDLDADEMSTVKVYGLGASFESTIDAGPQVRRWVATYDQCAEVIDELADQANYVWYIDPDRVLHFHARDKFDAPWTVTGSDVQFQGASLRRGNDAYRNQQWVVGGKDTTEPITEEFAGDGERRTFNVGFPIRRAPTVELNGSPQTVGVRGIDEDSSADWLFAHQSTELTQNRDNDKLTSTDLLEVTYKGVFEFVSRQDDEDALQDRRETEGGSTSGLVEKVVADGTIESRDEAFDLGARKLTKYGRPSTTLTVSTLRDGLRAGHLADVDLPALGVAGDMLVTRVEAREVAPGVLRWTATLVDGPHEASWRRLFRQLARPQTDQVLDNISEDETVTVLLQFSKDWSFAENPNMLRRLQADGSVQADGTFTATFRDDDRISYVEWTDLSGNVLGRSQLLQRAGLTTHEVTTVGYLSAEDGADGGVGELRWYGGHRATLEQGSGVLVATEVLDETKTTAEAWQLERVDEADDDWDTDRSSMLS